MHEPPQHRANPIQHRIDGGELGAGEIYVPRICGMSMLRTPTYTGAALTMNWLSRLDHTAAHSLCTLRSQHHR